MKSKLLNKIFFVIYYAIIQHLPHSRYSSIFGKLRKVYICNVLNIAISHPNSRFQNNIYLSGPGKVQIGQDCQINEHVFIQGAVIGNNVMIAPHVAILANVKDTTRLDIPMNKQGWSEKDKKVIIKNDVWIGRNVLVMPGITLEEGSIVAAGSVLTKDFPPYSILAGVPARLVKNRKSND